MAKVDKAPLTFVSFSKITTSNCFIVSFSPLVYLTIEFPDICQLSLPNKFAGSIFFTDFHSACFFFLFKAIELHPVYRLGSHTTLLCCLLIFRQSRSIKSNHNPRSQSEKGYLSVDQRKKIKYQHGASWVCHTTPERFL